MKVYHLPILIFAGVACASSAPKETASADAVEIKAAPPTPSISAAPSSSASLRVTEMPMQDPKQQEVGTLKLQETSNAILVLFETKKLTPGNYQVRVEENCQQKSSRKAASASDNLIKEFKIRGQDYSDEFKLRGYSFDEGEGQTLKNKAIKLYKVGGKSELKQAACGTVQL